MEKLMKKTTQKSIEDTQKDAIVRLFADGWTIARLAVLFGGTESFIEATIRHRMNRMSKQ